MRASHLIKAASLAAMTLFCTRSTLAQFEEGDNVLGVGLGLGGSYGIGFSGSGVSQTPAIALHFDHGMGELGPGVWGLGGFLGYKSYKYEYDNNWYNGRYTSKYKWNYTVVGVRGTWHWNEWHGVDELDTYGGLMLAYRIASFKDETNYPSGVSKFSEGSYSGVSLTGLLGARYWFSDKVGAFLELGFGVSNAQIGLAVKL